MSDLEETDRVEVIDLEEFARSKQPIPQQVKNYLIKVDKEKLRVQSPLSAGDILREAQLDPCDYHLQQKLHGGKREKLEPDQIIDLSKPGIERFESVPREACNG